MKLIILDRDGVINHDSDHYIRSVEQWIPIEQSIEAIARLSQAGYLIAIATNQSGIGRKYYSLATLNAMHDKMKDLVGRAGGKIDYITFCPHLPDDQCSCRKPKPGMLQKILTELSAAKDEQAADLNTWFVGDSLSDIQAGKAIGMQTVLVKTGKGEKTLTHPDFPRDTAVFSSLGDFCQQLLSNSSAE